MKKIITYIICIISPFLVMMCILLYLLNSCSGGEKYTENYLEKYDAYLMHAFGDYRVVEEKDPILAGVKIPAEIKFQEYLISYINIDGKEYEFYFNNIPGWLEGNLVRHADELSAPILEEKYISKYFPDQEFNRQRYFSYRISNVREEGYEEKLLDSKEGLQFRDFNINALSKYDLEIVFSFRYKLEDTIYGSPESMMKTFIEMLEAVYKDTRNPNIIGYITLYEEDGLSSKNYRVTYDKETKQMVTEEVIYEEYE